MRTVVRVVAVVLGLLVAALGSLWTLQGTGLIHLDPIACVGSCTPVEAASPTWTVAGLVAIAVGVALVVAGRRRR